MISSTKRVHRGSQYTDMVNNNDAKSFHNDNIDVDLERDAILANLRVRELTREQGSLE